ncbi:MAG TPA: DUF1810 domain-containing protein [Beijerinckiaceae bacterium]|jgi:uncharacterized protein (DUF1810 family)|nr:DUF1810 domain-containing protein [Beijerinckiaceae bacterium]
MNDPYNLKRFLEAQRSVYEGALAELRRGCKSGHWMWFVFPQVVGLGHSTTAHHYAIGSLAEARAYLREAILGPRLIACTEAVNAVEGRSAHDIFGWPDEMKFCSCMTLFEAAAPENSAFKIALRKYFGDNRDSTTLAKLKEISP